MLRRRKLRFLRRRLSFSTCGEDWNNATELENVERAECGRNRKSLDCIDLELSRAVGLRWIIGGGVTSLGTGPQSITRRSSQYWQESRRAIPPWGYLLAMHSRQRPATFVPITADPAYPIAW